MTCLLQVPSPARGFVVHSNLTPRSRLLLSPRHASTTECRRLAILGETLPSSSNKISPLFSTKAEVAPDVQQVGSKAESSFGGGAPVGSAAEAKRELLGLLASPFMDPDDTPSYAARMGYLLEELEAGYIPIQTIPFFNLASKVNARSK